MKRLLLLACALVAALFLVPPLRQGRSSTERSLRCARRRIRWLGVRQLGGAGSTGSFGNWNDAGSGGGDFGGGMSFGGGGGGNL